MKKFILLVIITLLISGSEIFGQNPRFNLLEDATYTDCGCCPCLDSVVRTCILPRLPNSSYMHYHWSWSGLHSDDCDSLAKKIMENQRKLNANRNGVYFDEPQYAHDLYKLCDSVVNVLKRDTVAPVKLVVKSKDYNPSTRNLTVKVDFTPYKNDLTGVFMVNMAVTENKILFQQGFHDSCGKPSGGTYHILHNNVVRQMAYYLYADKLTEGAWPVTSTLSKTFSLTLKPDFIAENCNYTVYIYKMEDSLHYSKVQQAFKGPVTWPLGIENPGLPAAILKISPNPAKDFVHAHINFNQPCIACISVTDQTGKLMEKLPPAQLDGGPYNYDIDVRKYSPGIYFLAVTINNQTITGKFIIARN